MKAPTWMPPTLCAAPRSAAAKHRLMLRHKNVQGYKCPDAKCPCKGEAARCFDCGAQWETHKGMLKGSTP